MYKNPDSDCTCVGCGCTFNKTHGWQSTCESCDEKRRHKAVYGHDKPETLEEVEE